MINVANPLRSVVWFVVVVAAMKSQLALAEEFTAQFSEPGLQSSVNVLITTEPTFVITGVPINSQTVWEISHREVSLCGDIECTTTVIDYTETDESGASATPPSLSQVIVLGPRTYTASITTQDRPEPVEFLWHITGAYPDPAAGLVAVEPLEPSTGESLVLHANLRNEGHLPTDTAPQQQRLDYFLNDELIGSMQYDDLAAGEYRQNLIPLGTITEPGTYTVRTRVDAANLIDMLYPFIGDLLPLTIENNENSYTFSVHGPDWLKVPDIIGKYVHATPLLDPPFKVVEIRRSGDAGPYYPRVGELTPAANSWVAPTDTEILVAAGSKSLCNAAVVSPYRHEKWARGSTQTIRWQSESLENCHCDLVQISLWKNDEWVRLVANAIPNDGEYVWKIKKKKFQKGNYQIRIDSENDPVSYIVQSFSITRGN
ncbi:MAG: hypothetical protein HUU46_12425 [Candidatus Hydrogenedentes bacterium]|nr:hypothetical protein [Candidatus Hydrogenedentota bacterium]